MKIEIKSLQVVRAIAAVSVVLNHMIGASPGDIFYFTRSIGDIGVDLFFVLSGLIMIFTMKESETPLDFLKKRIIRIYPAYLILSLPIFLWSIYKLHPNAWDVITNITLIPRIDASFTRFNIVNWTLIYEMYFYVAMSIAMLASRNKKNVVLITSIIILTPLFLIPNTGGGAFENLSFKSIASNYILIDFVAGMFIGFYFSKSPPNMVSSSWRPISSIIFFLASTTLMISSDLHLENDQVKRLLFSGIPSLIIIFIISYYKSNSFIFNKLKEIGDASYSIYLTHTTIRVIAWRFESIFIRFIFSIVVIVVGCLCYFFIEKRTISYFRRKHIKK